MGRQMFSIFWLGCVSARGRLNDPTAFFPLFREGFANVNPPILSVPARPRACQPDDMLPALPLQVGSVDTERRPYCIRLVYAISFFGK